MNPTTFFEATYGQSQNAFGGCIFGQAGTGPLALSRKRYWEVKADLLTLTTKDDAGKPLSVGVWRRGP